MTEGVPGVVRLESVSKSFGSVRAVAPLSLGIARGERLGIIGHNGAGKSTLMNVLIGMIPPDQGHITVEGADVTVGYDVSRAFSLGIRCVFQELALCTNLSVGENLRLQHRNLKGRGWRGRAERMIGETLEAIFPGHGIDPRARVGRLSIGERQQVEIARAFTVVDQPIRLVVLDEPTSSLDAVSAEQLLRYIRRVADEGVASVFISHRLGEVLSAVQGVVVMLDGRIVAVEPADRMTKDAIVSLMMGNVPTAAREASGGPTHLGPLRIEVSGPVHRGRSLTVRGGEIVGLAGLDGHGQRRLLHRLFLGRRRSGEAAATNGRLAYVSGDRGREGVFPLWSMKRNLSIGLLDRLSLLRFVPPARERRLAETWRETMSIRIPDVEHAMLGLSGGNQQKVLIARALASGAAAILLDDPTRGVDITTKLDFYDLVRREAREAARAFLWYTTELEELEICDRCYVFYEDRIVDDVPREAFAEGRILRASFAEA